MGCSSVSGKVSYLNSGSQFDFVKGWIAQLYVTDSSVAENVKALAQNSANREICAWSPKAISCEIVKRIKRIFEIEEKLVDRRFALPSSVEQRTVLELHIKLRFPVIGSAFE